MRLMDRILGRDPLPPGFPGRLDADERVLATASETVSTDARSADAPPGADARSVGAPRGYLVATSHGLWLPGAAERLSWHLVTRAIWRNGAIELVEAHEQETLDGAVLITDAEPRRLRLADPGTVPEVVRARVEASIRSRHHRDLPTGGAWFVQRKVPGRDGIMLQIRPDPGTDLDTVRQLAVDVAAQLRSVNPSRR